MYLKFYCCGLYCTRVHPIAKSVSPSVTRWLDYEFNIWPITAMKAAQNWSIYLGKLDVLPNNKGSLSKWPKLVNIMPKWRIFATSGHTDKSTKWYLNTSSMEPSSLQCCQETSCTHRGSGRSSSWSRCSRARGTSPPCAWTKIPQTLRQILGTDQPKNLDILDTLRYFGYF